MDSHDIFGWIIAITFGVTTALSMNFLIVDYRNFDTIVKQCTSRGAIQNDQIRIICGPEKAEKAL